jgi:hypothetical protein
MPQKATNVVAVTGNTEATRIILLSELLSELVENELIDEDGNLAEGADMIVIGIPDTGKARFNGSHVIEKGKQAGKDSKATFIVAESQGFFGDAVDYRQSQGDVAGLPLNLKFSLTATPPNRAAKTVDEALNRAKVLTMPESDSEVKTGTND